MKARAQVMVVLPSARVSMIGTGPPLEVDLATTGTETALRRLIEVATRPLIAAPTLVSTVRPRVCTKSSTNSEPTNGMSRVAAVGRVVAVGIEARAAATLRVALGKKATRHRVRQPPRRPLCPLKRTP
jgi:hypothetical protein